jgi:Spy/CpxP family protein refolding chaperone
MGSGSCDRGFSGALSLRAEDTAGAVKPAEAAAEKPAKKVRLTKPWSDIASLTDEQKAKIVAIHKDITDQIKALQEKEKTEVTALLTDEQKAELARVEEEIAAKKKMMKPAADASTTKPAKE